MTLATEPPTPSALPPGPGGIRALHRSGLLAEHFPRLGPVLDALGADDLDRAGELIRRLGAEPVLALYPGTPVVAVELLGSFTATPLLAPLAAQLARHGLLMRATAEEGAGPLPVLPHPASDEPSADDPSDDGAALRLTVAPLDARFVFDRLPVPWRVEDAEQALTDAAARVAEAARAHAAAGAGTLVLTTVPLVRRFAHQLVDLRSRTRLSVAWREFNAALLRLALDLPGTVVLDLEPLLAEGGPVSDERASVYAQAHLGPGLLGRIARELGHLARSGTGRVRKGLVLDLDNTLWGGVLGDDGPDGIEVAGGTRGIAFQEFQRLAVQLGSQGVLLAVASKNDDTAVREVLRDHPELALRERHLVAVEANWGDKPSSLRTIAARLNLGTDAFVFADDSTFECGMVREVLPEVAVVQLDGDPAEHVTRLLEDGWFLTPEVTEEDRERTEGYRNEAARSELLAAAASPADYLAGLGVRVEVFEPGPGDVARIAQLTQRTNQFNVTTRRLGENDVRALLADPDELVLAVRTADRFGGQGVVGALFARRSGDRAEITGMQLSCRVFSRGIETAAIAVLLERLRADGVRSVTARYLPTRRNAVVAGLWPDHGFTPAPGPSDETGAGDGTGQCYQRDLADPLPVPDHIELVRDGVRTPAPTVPSVPTPGGPPCPP